MKVLIVNHSDISGGAARAAYRIHSALLEAGNDSRMLVNARLSGDWTVQEPTGKLVRVMARLRPQITTRLCKVLCPNNQKFLSPSIFPSRLSKHINATNADVVNLHWVQWEMLSVYDFSLIRKPIVWTLHDMWPFSGAEHYTTEGRWREGYNFSNRPSDESGFDLNRWTWQRKRKHWHRPIQIVCPSNWLADCVRSSALMHNWPVDVIPNPIDTNRWIPINKCLARQLLSLPQDVPLLLFGALGGGSDSRKGMDLLVAALAQLRSDSSLKTMQLAVFGQVAPKSPPQIGFPVHYAGPLHDDLSLRCLYSAADVMVIPSRQDNLPNTGLEAHACGTPVVAFNTGGLPDIVADRLTGVLAEPFDTASLAEAIRWVLEDPLRRRAMGSAARERAMRLWSPARVARLYSKAYGRALVPDCQT